MLPKHSKKIKQVSTMDRRTALKNLTIGIGYTVATPTILSVLSSCSNNTETWTPLFLSEDEKYMVTHLVDIILPKDDLPGALDVNIPQFIDKMYHDIEVDTKKNIFKKGAAYFAEDFKKEISEVKKDDFKKSLESYFNLSDEDSKEILEAQNRKIENVSTDAIKSYSIYKFLLSIRYYTIFGYCTSEKIGETILAYDPVPGAYNGCISLEETKGRAWSL